MLNNSLFKIDLSLLAINGGCSFSSSASSPSLVLSLLGSVILTFNDSITSPIEVNSNWQS